MLRAARELLAVRSPLDAELMVSEMLGTWWGHRLERGNARGQSPRGEVEELFGEGLVDYAAEAGSPAALALLAGIAGLGTPRQAAKAELAALELMERGVAQPSWADSVGAVVPGDCYVSRNIYGDTDEVICCFTYAGREGHALVVVVDYNASGMVRDAWVTSEVDELLARARRTADDDPRVHLEELAGGAARAMLESGLRVTDELTDPPVSESFASYHAFVRARIHALPPPGRKRVYAARRDPYSADRRATIAAEFLASDEAEGLSDLAAAGRCVDHIINYGCDRDFGRPLRISPMKVERFLLDWLPRKVMLSTAEQESFPHVLAAWVRWSGKREGLPESAIRDTLDAVWEATARFAETYRDPTTFGLDLDLVTRLLPDGDLEALPRRAFAFPLLHGRHGTTELDNLDPANSADRLTLLEIEHALDGSLTGNLDLTGEPPDGTDKALEAHLEVHRRVADRLWRGEPAELWEAAQRLLDLGHDRHDVLHSLMEVLVRVGEDPAGLRAALNALPPTG